MLRRHDIVHRNGRNKKGEKISIYRQDIEDIWATVRELADFVDVTYQLHLDLNYLENHEDPDSTR